MEEYDVFIVGGGIAGSIAAKFAAASGLRTIFIEKKKTPRNKPCSGIQFGYFEKIMGEKIPQDRLCNDKLTRIEMHFPSGKKFRAPFKMFNFMRKPFDDWLNIVAQDNGAEFLDECEYKDHEEVEEGIIVTYKLKSQEGDDQYERVKARYLVDATGLFPAIRKKLRPQDFKSKSGGSTLNYYIDGTANMDPRTLYQFWNMDWNDAMFAWVYRKTLDDGKDYWVVGTGCNKGKVKDRQTLFYEHIQEKFQMQGEIVKKEGYSSTIDMLSKDRVWLGQGRIIMVGDAAGLVDQVRGVGMDAAALSGRLVAKAILISQERGTGALEEYRKLMKAVVKQTKNNQNREIGDFKDNKELQKHLSKNMIKTGMGMMFHNFLNRFKSPEKQKLLPP